MTWPTGSLKASIPQLSCQTWAGRCRNILQATRGLWPHRGCTPEGSDEVAKTAGPGNSSRSSEAGWPRQCECAQLSATLRTSLLRGARFTECASCRGGWDACPEEEQGRASRTAPRPPGASPRAGFRFGGSEMTEPGASPEDPWVKVEYAYSDNSLDPGLFVESTRKGSVVSRANSIGSTSASSVPNTDDEDSDYHQESYKESYKDRRRRAHTQAEQKRRDAIKRGYDDLQTIVPTCQQQDFSIGSQKLSKAIVLQKTIDYIQFLHKEKKKQEEEVSTLRKDVMALKIMKVNYEQIVKAHQDNPHEGEDQVSDQVKFNVFQGIMDSLFQSFNASISVASFQELSACVFSWIEEHCKPQTLREIVIGVLHQLKNQLY
ncbi:max-like protein X isoform X2 [Delphinus delphis]|uniref:max-like protein X isoform X2 n=1 Tax=Delphinus delphis TaxID=9728 RepID=UPI0028C475D5|nr:max-like protein X isoform X2 [Delphinus delphis]